MPADALVFVAETTLRVCCAALRPRGIRTWAVVQWVLAFVEPVVGVVENAMRMRSKQSSINNTCACI
jgi:hypothetical protein